ncbi:hypothetical protein HPB47_026889 [Ixodes persulcatus]|uniref:Uncharacterized protein n=1 Tax=Ixodes persulcatus TaxID=34615 RepID=A0AC60PZ56_IXOPE|nr:hypothetical protein HPB47_026889 [Ixodes persulcatus]
MATLVISCMAIASRDLGGAGGGGSRDLGRLKNEGRRRRRGIRSPDYPSFLLLKRTSYRRASKERVRPLSSSFQIHELIQTTPIPRNMSPTLHAGRRTARAKALQHIYGIRREDVRYTDAAMYPDRSMAAISVIGQDKKTPTTATVRTKPPAVAEEMAIALAIVANGPQHISILTAFQTAIRRFRAGRISPQAFHALQTKGSALPKVALIWTPGNKSVEGNRHANAVARACTIRAPDADTDQSTEDSSPFAIPFPEVLAFQRGQRFKYLPPHHSLTREEATTGRQLQMTTSPPTVLSPSPDDQQMLVQRAKAAAESTGALD